MSVPRNEAADAQAVATFLTEVFRSPDPTRSGRTITVAESLERAAARLKLVVPEKKEEE